MSSFGAAVSKSKSTTLSMGPSASSPMHWEPREYQKKVVRFVVANAVGALLLDMGMGKTTSILAAIKILKGKGFIGKVLVIAPLRVCHAVWPEEIKKWEDFADLKVEVLHGPKKEEALAREADIYVINPEGLEWLSYKDRDKRFGENDVLVVDESTMFKHTTTRRFKLLKYLLPRFKRRYILTGTPAPNGLMDLFGQFYILDEGAALGRFITQYRTAYFDPSGYMGYDWKLKPDAEERIYARIEPYVIRLDAADHLSLPERINNTLKVELPGPARRAYRELEMMFLTLLKDGEAVTAPSAAAVGVKLRQVANGAMYRNAENRDLARTEKEEWVHLHDAKLDALDELVQSQQGKPVLVAYEFDHDAQRLKKRFPEAVFLSSISQAKLPGVIARWNAGEIPMLCAHPASAGHGLNLQGACNTVAWFGLTWNLELYQQFNARVLRQGNAHQSVFIHHIIAEDTIDEVVMKAIINKRRLQDELLDAMKEANQEV